MNLLVICPHFEPDLAPTGEVMTRLGDELVARGHRLQVVTSLPWYQHHRVEHGWTGRPVRYRTERWGEITRVHPFPTDKRNIPARALGFAGFTALASGMATSRRLGRHTATPDAVLAMSPPLTLGPAGWLAARRWSVPFVFNIQDVFPDVAIELGAITNPAVITFASWLERWCYSHADAVTVLSDDLQDNLVTKLRGRIPDPLDRVRVIPNFVDTAWITPRDTDAGGYRREHGLAGKKVVMYAGNVGFSQSFHLILDAARAMADRPDVVFVINGGGSARLELERDAARLTNVRFVDYQPKERLPDVLAAADIQLVPLKRGLARSSVPSKTYSILAAGRPVVASVDAGTEVARVVEHAGAGIAVPPDDPGAFIAAVTKLLDHPDTARAMGDSGRAFVERWASPAAIAARYEELFEELRARRRFRPAGYS